VIAADGASSGVRHQLRVETDGPGDMGHFLNVMFRADYGPHLERRLSILYTKEDYFCWPRTNLPVLAETMQVLLTGERLPRLSNIDTATTSAALIESPSNGQQTRSAPLSC
jgi:hypothetical protein